MKRESFDALLQFRSILVLIGLLSLGGLYSQDNRADFNPRSFLDPTFLGEPEESSEEDSFTEPESGEETGRTTIPPSVFFQFDFINLPRYNLINTVTPYDPSSELYFPSFDNLLQIQNQLRYTFWERKITFNWNSSLYVLVEEKDGSQTAFTSDWGYYLNEANMNFRITDPFNFGIGKIDIGEGTAFLANPTDFLDTRSRFDDFSIYYQNRAIGSYQIKLDFFFGNWEWSLAYLPMFHTVYHEWSRSYADRNPYFGELWSRVSWQVENLKTKLLFYWNGYPQGGINLSATLGDEVVLFFDGAGKVVSLPVIYREGDIRPGGPYLFPNYEIEEEYQYRGQGLIGLTYTPDLFTFSAEVYANLGSENRLWDNHLDDLKNVEETAMELEDHTVPLLRPLALEYWGLMNEAFKYHDPFTLQPVFIGISFFRNDAFSDYTAQIFHFNTRLIYSPLDTGFLWMNQIAWQSPKVFMLGLFTSWYFGKEEGVLTSTPRTFSLGLATQFTF